VAAGEVAVLIEGVVEGGVRGAEFLERFHSSEFEHSALSSPEWLM
jgi:hypothetical protein